MGEGWIGEETVALVLYCFFEIPGGFNKTVLRGANTSGDTYSVACIAGSISGAYLGIAATPDKWIINIEKANYLEDLALRLASAKEHTR